MPSTESKMSRRTHPGLTSIKQHSPAVSFPGPSCPVCSVKLSLGFLVPKRWKCRWLLYIPELSQNCRRTLQLVHRLLVMTP